MSLYIFENDTYLTHSIYEKYFFLKKLRSIRIINYSITM